MLTQMLAIIERTAQPQYSDETEPIPDAVWHADAVDLAGQNAALDLIDRLLELDAFRFNQSLSDFDR